MSSRHQRRIAYSQNFLKSRQLVQRLVDDSTISAHDLVLEIGPGKGLITSVLADRCRGVIAVEKDPSLASALSNRLKDVSNVVLFAGDFLTFPVPLTPYKVFANIPFRSTSAIVAKLVSGSSPPADAYLVMQLEAAAKFVGQPQESLASVLLKPDFAPSIVHRFRHSDFEPRPGVDTVLVRFAQRTAPLVPQGEGPLFRDFVVTLFTAWQPTVRDALAHGFHRRVVAPIEREVGETLARRPIDTPFELWLRLYRVAQDQLGLELERTVSGAEQRLKLEQSHLEKSHRTRSRAGRPVV